MIDGAIGTRNRDGVMDPGEMKDGRAAERRRVRFLAPMLGDVTVYGAPDLAAAEACIFDEPANRSIRLVRHLASHTIQEGESPRVVAISDPVGVVQALLFVAGRS